MSECTVEKQSDAKALEIKDKQWPLIEDMLPILQQLQAGTPVMSSETNPSASTLDPQRMPSTLNGQCV